MYNVHLLYVIVNEVFLGNSNEIYLFLLIEILLGIFINISKFYEQSLMKITLKNGCVIYII